LFYIGSVTAVIGDIASMFGCSLGLPDEITAITFIAVGTSLPDTFGSRMAAICDHGADAAVTNVTGSNAVNVFLGVGIPWLMGVVYWNAELGIGLLVSSSGASTFSFHLICYLLVAAIAYFVLHLRRTLFGGELGGPMSVRVASISFLLYLWFFYVAVACWRAVEHRNLREPSIQWQLVVVVFGLIVMLFLWASTNLMLGLIGWPQDKDVQAFSDSFTLDQEGLVSLTQNSSAKAGMLLEDRIKTMRELASHLELYLRNADQKIVLEKEADPSKKTTSVVPAIPTVAPSTSAAVLAPPPPATTPSANNAPASPPSTAQAVEGAATAPADVSISVPPAATE